MPVEGVGSRLRVRREAQKAVRRQIEQNARLERIQAEREHELAKIRLLSATGLIQKLVK